MLNQKKTKGENAERKKGNNTESNIIVVQGKVVVMICPKSHNFTGRKFDKILNFLASLARDGALTEISFLFAGGQLQKTSNKASNSEENKNGIPEENGDGTDWKDRHWDRIKEKLGNFTNGSDEKLKFLTWDVTVVKDSRYQEFLKLATSTFETVKPFKDAVTASIVAYLNTHFKEEAATIGEKDPRWKNCFDYKMQEVAGLFVKKALGFDSLVYPGELCPGLDYALNCLVNNKESSPNLTFLKVPKAITKSGRLLPRNTSNSNSSLEIRPSSVTALLKHNGIFNGQLNEQPNSIFALLNDYLENSKTPEEVKHKVLILYFSISEHAQEILCKTTKANEAPTEGRSDNGIHFDKDMYINNDNKAYQKSP